MVAETRAGRRISEAGENDRRLQVRASFSRLFSMARRVAIGRGPQLALPPPFCPRRDIRPPNAANKEFPVSGFGPDRRPFDK